MCGIVGYIGKRDAQGILTSGLRRLEYRGYDSAGIVTVGESGDPTLLRAKGKVSELTQLVSSSGTKDCVGIGHTRWATHGEPSVANAHPHRAGDIFLVHNGIIENFKELKAELPKHKFVSETDSEVLAALVDSFYDEKTSLLDAVTQALELVVGTYGIAVVSTRQPDEIIVARSGSPLIIGVGKDETLIASDASALIGHTDRAIYLNDGEIAVLKRFLNTDIKEIRIFSRDEKKQDDMRKAYNNDKLKFYIGDVRNPASIKDAVKGVDFIFHAAALKQVPSCEFFPMEAVRTNVLGTDNVLNAAIDAGVKRVVCLSTDKAAYPINAMGTSKAMMEKVIIAKSRNVDPKDTTISCTRYGNVMASRGSVIPLFVEQIKSDAPLTITNPDMTRFLMNLNEAVDLVLFAFEHANQGDLFVQKAPASTIGDLAAALIKMFKSKSEIKVIGTRHGEKAHETLMTKEERAKAEDMGDYFRVPADSRDLNYNKYLEDGSKEITEAEEYTSFNTERLDIDGTINKLLTVDYVNEEIQGITGVQS